MEERLKAHSESLARAIRFTRTADAKAAPVLALQIALLGTLAARSERLVAILVADAWGAEQVILLLLLVAYALAMLAAVAMAARVYIPIHPRTCDGDSLIYFEDIAAMPYKSFAKQAQEMSPEDIEEQLLRQIHAVSKIASVKMHRARRAFWLSGLSLALGIILLAWGSVPLPSYVAPL